MLFISGAVCWSYYAYVVCVVATAMQKTVAEQVLCAIIYHIMFVLFVWSYWMAIFTPAGNRLGLFPLTQ